MIAKINSSAVLGISAYLVEVEVDISRGIPSYSTVGLPDSAVKESKDRVEAAIKNSGLVFPLKRITVNLAPADIKKEGSAFDLPIALGVLAAQGTLNKEELGDFIVSGELSLNGELRGIRGALPTTLAAKEGKFKGIIIPEDNKREAGIVNGINVYPIKNLNEAVDFLNENLELKPYSCDVTDVWGQASRYDVDLSDVKGQESAKRALEVAAAGGHNVIMIGPPGAGKTMLARRIPTILPELTLDEALETTKIHSVAGLIQREKAVVATRPFRAPHHTISDAGLIGGGAHPRPGEVSLAHNGVLFLDEFTEFNKNVLEVLRQPLEDEEVTISRAALTLTFPARFMLIAAMNPCPCGYFGDLKHECTCTPGIIQRYVSKVSGPLLDRIDIHVEVPALDYKELQAKKQGEPSESIRARINKARKTQLVRYKAKKGVYSNAQLTSKEITKYCLTGAESERLLVAAIQKFGLSARAYDRILKVGRTIADLDGSEEIRPEHLSEAIQYRTLDRKYWLR